MKKLLNLLEQDFALAKRNKYPHIIVFMIILNVLLINYFIPFIFPQQVEVAPQEYVVDLTQGKIVEEHLKANKGFGEENFFETKEELVEKLNEYKYSQGLVFSGTRGDFKVTIIKQGFESESTIRLLAARVDEVLNELSGEAAAGGFETTSLRPGSEKIALKDYLVPLFVIPELFTFFMMLVAVMIFQEKGDGSIIAYRATPGGALRYILSKTIVNTAYGLFFTVSIVFLALGSVPNLVNLVVLSTLAMTIGVFASLAVSVYFDTFPEFIYVAFLAGGIVGLPGILYMVPSISIKLVTYLPTYDALFAFKEILFPTGNYPVVRETMINLFVASLVLFAIAYRNVEKKLMKAG